MGRFLSGGGTGGTPRKQSIRLLVSNPSVQIPSWARVAYITGTAAGGGGGNGNGSDRGAGGGSGGWANRLPMQINGETSVAVAIGAAGIGGSPGGNPGGNAGNTTVSIGSVQLRLGGGGGGAGGAGNVGGQGGLAIVGRPDDVNPFPTAQPDGAPFSGQQLVAGTANGVFGSASSLGQGANGGGGNQVNRGAGGLSLFGGAGRRSQTTSPNDPGGLTSGFGGGGGGGNGTGAGSDGAPGFVMIDFEETL